MSDLKHTPGPWRVEGHRRVGLDLTGHIISHGINAYGDGPEGYVCNTSGTTDANARLIAAAPQLKDALIDMLDHYVGLVNSGDAGNWNPETETKVIAARAAIAAATGDA